MLFCFKNLAYISQLAVAPPNKQSIVGHLKHWVWKELVGPADTGQASVLVDPHQIVGIEIFVPVDLHQFKEDGVIQPPAAHRGR